MMSCYCDLGTGMGLCPLIVYLAMESVTEKIAREVGPKWIQLYSRLGLGPRDRWRIDSEHADKPTETKLQNCARDCIQLWRKTVQDLDEMEAIRELLIALRKVQGFAHLAEELSKTNGISLEASVPGETEAPNSPPDVGLATGRPLQTQVGHPTEYSVSDVEQRHLSQPSSTSTHQDEDSASSVAISDTEPVDSGYTDTDSAVTFDEILQNPIDMKNRMHKFAILDISQRLKANKWQTLARKLEIPNTRIQHLKRTENVAEERYYQLLMEWLNDKQEAATFSVLRDVLETSDQKSAVDIIIRRRLMHHNETL